MLTRWLVILAVCGATRFCQSAEDVGYYLKHIKPLLRERCYTCHGALKQESGLRLDTARAMIRGGDSGAVIVRGDPSTSILLQRVAADDPSERMPPEQEGEPLSAEQVRLFRDWIAAGAAAPKDEKPEQDPKDHWAFRPIVRPRPPKIAKAGWIRNPVDAFLARRRRQHGLTPQGEAPRTVLLRRLYFDLIGLPPTAEEITTFENDRSPRWYERAVDRLLEDPRHGERWARHWMDIWRYSDWWGLGQQLRNSQKHIWHWRDWIVESLNADTPYDQMLRLMLAADELHPHDLDKLRATGFLARNYFLFNRNQWMEETVEHVSKGILGLTLNCAKCHDHKYDPIRQTDFYRMRAFFEPYHVRVDVVAGEPDLSRNGVPRVFDGWLNKPTYRFVRGQENRPDKSRVMKPGAPEFLAFKQIRIEPVSLPAEAWQPQRRPWVIDAHLAAARRKIAEAQAALAKAQRKTTAKVKTAAENAQAELKVAEAALAAARAEHLSVESRAKAMRAAWEGKDEQEKTAAAVGAERQVFLAKARQAVAVAELAVLNAADDKMESAAKKLKMARQSLTKSQTRAAAEAKPTDAYTLLLGAKWTPTRFLFSGKDDPTVEFPSRSTGRRTALAGWITDRRNPLTARVAVNHIWMRHMGAPLAPTVFDFGRNGAPPAHSELLDWLASELMDSGWSVKHLHRLIVSSQAYRMNTSVAGGEANVIKDPDNRFWWRRTPIRLESQVVRDSILAHAGALDLTMGGPPIPAAQQDASRRRSLYFFHSNNNRNLFLTMFDEAGVKECYRREQSIVPQQALALTNSRLVLDASPPIAQRLSEDAADDAAFVRKCFTVLLGIAASDAEIAASKNALRSWRDLPGGPMENLRAHFVWALINHNDFVTLR